MVSLPEAISFSAGNGEWNERLFLLDLRKI